MLKTRTPMAIRPITWFACAISGISTLSVAKHEKPLGNIEQVAIKRVKNYNVISLRIIIFNFQYITILLYVSFLGSKSAQTNK